MNKQLKATPENEDFGYKYTNTGKIGKYLIARYFNSVNKLIRVALEDSSSDKYKTALEVGCGEGYSTEKLRGYLPETIELHASEYVEKLVKRAQERNPDVEIMQENIYKLKRKDNSIDILFLLEVLEHLDYPTDAITEIKRVTSSYAIIGVPREPIWRLLNFARGKYIRDFGNTPGHLNHWSSNAIVKYLEDNLGEVIAMEKPLPWTICLIKVANE